MALKVENPDVHDLMINMGRAAREAARYMMTTTPDQRTNAINAMADAIIKHQPEILNANASDVDAAKARGTKVPATRYIYGGASADIALNWHTH